MVLRQWQASLCSAVDRVDERDEPPDEPGVGWGWGLGEKAHLLGTELVGWTIGRQNEPCPFIPWRASLRGRGGVRGWEGGGGGTGAFAAHQGRGESRPLN